MEDLKATHRSEISEYRGKIGLIKTRFKDRYLNIDSKVLVLSIGGFHEAD